MSVILKETFYKLITVFYKVILKNWWGKDLKKKEICPKLSKNIECEYLVIGGGIAGLHAALYLADLKKDVVLLEKTFCGGSSSGKSSGFLTPASEQGLSQMVKKYGVGGAKTVWEIPCKGVEEIKNNIDKYKIKCEIENQDCLCVGIGSSGLEGIEEEVEACKKMGVKYKYYNKKALTSVLNTKVYTAGIRTFDTYSINSLLYCFGLRNVLLKKGVRIFENSEVLGISDSSANTETGSVKVKKIIVCVDKLKPQISEEFSKKIYHAQTFLAISRKLSKKEIKSIFPSKKFMCWDSKLIYSYFKLTKDDRMLVGGSSYLAIYSPKEINSDFFVKDIIKNFKEKFPQLKELEFVAYWNGLIDIAKDIMPILDFDEKNRNIQYVLGNPGLPWAAFLGTYAAKRALEKEIKSMRKYDKYLSAKRKFFISDSLQSVIGKIPSFVINNLYAEFYQIDKKL